MDDELMVTTKILAKDSGMMVVELYNGRGDKLAVSERTFTLDDGDAQWTWALETQTRLVSNALMAGTL